MLLRMDGTIELRKIEKEIIEARGLIIKSNNLANSLSADVRSIARRQSSYERNLSMGSFVAYVLFAAIAFGGSQLAYHARKASLEAELATVRQEATEAQQELAILKKEKGSDVPQAAQDLTDLYEFISDGQMVPAIEAYEKLNLENLTFLEKKLLSDVINSFKGDLSMQSYVRGLNLLSQKKYAESVEEFKQSLLQKSDAGHAKAAKIQMANALRMQGKPQEAIAVLQKVIEEHLDPELSDDALWYLALSHTEAHQRDEARSVLRALMRQYPSSQFYRDARVRAAELQLHLYNADDKAKR